MKFAFIFLFCIVPSICRSSFLTVVKLSSPLGYDRFLSLVQVAGESSQFQPISPVRFNVKARALGNVSITFRYLKVNGVSRPVSNQTIRTLLFKGSAKIGRDEVPVAGSIFLSNPEPKEFDLQVDFRKPYHNRFFHIQATIDVNGVVRSRLTRASQRVLSAFKCSSLSIADKEASNVESSQSDTMNPTPAVKIFSISTEADWEWYRRYGIYSNAQIASILNVVEVLYTGQLGLSLNLVGQHLFTSKRQPYSQTDSDDLINNFRSYSIERNHLETADIYHLFTGKNLDGNVQGIAWVGVACNAPEYSFGLTQRVNQAVQAIITAHEIAHNFGANHDNTPPRTIMSAVVATPILAEFSILSRFEINSHLDEFGELCLIDDVLEPTPTVVSGDGEPAPSIELKTSLSRGGRLLAQAVSEAALNKCQLTIKGSPIKRRVREGIELGVLEPTLYVSEWEALVKRQALGRIVSGRPVSRARLFFVVENSCDGYENSFSNITTIRANKVSSTKRKVSRKKWLLLLQRKLLNR